MSLQGLSPHVAREAPDVAMGSSGPPQPAPPLCPAFPLERANGQVWEGMADLHCRSCRDEECPPWKDCPPREPFRGPQLCSVPEFGRPAWEQCPSRAQHCTPGSQGSLQGQRPLVLGTTEGPCPTGWPQPSPPVLRPGRATTPAPRGGALLRGPCCKLGVDTG